MEIFYVTGNKHKLTEAQALISNLKELNLDLDEIQSLDPYEIIKHKLEEAKKKFNGNLIVDDVSMNLECINGLPGPLIKWFIKSLGPLGLYNLTKNYKNNKAIVRCIIGLSINNKIEFFEGVVNGKIVEPRGINGFGFDSVFQPDGYAKTYAEMTLYEKNKISHRSLALEKLKEYLAIRKL